MLFQEISKSISTKIVYRVVKQQLATRACVFVPIYVYLRHLNVVHDPRLVFSTAFLPWSTKL